MLMQCANPAAFLRTHFRLDWHGLHGARHWARVAFNGRLLARAMHGVNMLVLRNFALLHDLARDNEGTDHGHGQRAVELISHYGGAGLLGMHADAFEELVGAISEHSSAVSGGTLTQRVCWDADRLDLWRVGIMPDPDRLFTDAGRRLHFDRLYAGYYR